MRRRSVLFPTPLGPNKQVHWPAGKEKSSVSNKVWPSKAIRGALMRIPKIFSKSHSLRRYNPVQVQRVIALAAIPGHDQWCLSISQPFRQGPPTAMFNAMGKSHVTSRLAHCLWWPNRFFDNFRKSQKLMLPRNFIHYAALL